ncbi:cell wall-binding repeat-containing protein [Clostridium sp. MT-14]|uniref:cell wall-binding repeat-containing protein n=1 Tax=Clostridium sp. MT-14 TaxID=3348360 RepID=UPI00156CBFD0|nr:exported hypothetical protein [Clostridiaceae bacterium BL-3]
MNRKKIMSMLLPVGILWSMLFGAGDGFMLGGNTVKAFTLSNGDVDAQIAPKKTNTGWITSDITEPDNVLPGLGTEPTNYIEVPDDSDLLTDKVNWQYTDSYSDNIIASVRHKFIDVSKLNLDGKVYRYKFTANGKVYDTYYEVRRMYATYVDFLQHNSDVQCVRVVSYAIFVDGEVAEGFSNRSFVYESDTGELPYLRFMIYNSDDELNPLLSHSRKPTKDNYPDSSEEGFIPGSIAGEGEYPVYSPYEDSTPGGNSDTGESGDVPVGGTINFTRLAGDNRYKTAVSIAEEYSGTNSVDNIIVASGKNFPDSLAGATLAKKLDAPILLLGDSEEDLVEITKYITRCLNSDGNLYVLGGDGVISQEFLDRFSYRYNIIRLAGTNREETASKIVDTIQPAVGTPIVIANEDNYPDALSISPVAAENGYPIMITKQDKLADYIKKYIGDKKPEKIYFVGGTGSVSENVRNEVKQLTGLSDENTPRIAGKDRYGTSLAIAKAFDFGNAVFTVVNGLDFPDAITGSVLSASKDSPILLADVSGSSNMGDLKDYIKSSGFKNAYVLGGTGVFPKEVMDKLAD